MNHTSLRCISCCVVILMVASVVGGQELWKELRQMDALRKGKATPFEEVERLGEDLRARYPQPKDRGQIYYQMAHTFAQSGQAQPDKTITYAKKALNYPLDPDRLLMLYVYWGDAVRAAGRDQPFPETRKKAALVYLEGLKEYDKLVEAKNDSPLPKGLEKHRDVLSGQLVQMYSRAPFAEKELEQLTGKVVQDQKLVDSLRAKTQTGVAETKERVSKAEEKLRNTPDVGWSWGSTGLLIVLALAGVGLAALFTIRHFLRSRKANIAG